MHFQERVPQGDYYKYDADIPSENGGVSPKFSRGINIPQGDNCEKQFSKVLHKVNVTIERNEMRLADQDRKDYIKLEWQQVAIVIDRTLMLCFLILLIAVTMSLLIPPSDDLGEGI